MLTPTQNSETSEKNVENVRVIGYQHPITCVCLEHRNPLSPPPASP